MRNSLSYYGEKCEVRKRDSNLKVRSCGNRKRNSYIRMRENRLCGTVNALVLS